VLVNIHVVATTPSGTRAALAATATFGAGLATRTTLLVPYVVPYVQESDPPAELLAFALDRFRRLAREIGEQIEVQICVCRPHDATLAPLLSRDTTVLVGGKSRRYWPTRAQRLAADLAQNHYPVLFVEEA
jgi:hypothetical protein